MSFVALAVAGLSLATATVRAQSYNRWAPIVPNITWSPCDGDDNGTGYTCGFLDVPMDYANSTAGKATLALVKYPYQTEPRLGTLFVNPGGPGGSGTDFLLGSGVALSSFTGAQYDIVAWDPRGVGNTYPKINCFNTTEDEAAFWQGTIPEQGIEAKGNFTSSSTTDPDVAAFWAQEPEVDNLLGQVGQLCLQINGDTLQYVGTAANIRDILAISDQLDGAGGLIHYWGFSYGTVIGSYLVQMFPDRVGRVIVDGVVNPWLWADNPSYMAWGYKIQDTDAVFAGFTSACATAGASGCPIASTDSTSESINAWVHALMDSAYDYLKSGGNFGSAYIRNLIFQSMYTPKTWSSTASTLYQLADFLYQSNNTYVKRDLPTLDKPHTLWGIPRRTPSKSNYFTRRSGLTKRDTDESLYDYAFQAITCADAIDSGNTTTTDVFNEIVNATVTVSEMFGPMFGDGGFWCHKWPARAVERFGGPWNNTLKNAIIVIGNKADPITPYPGAQFVAESLGSSAFLVEQDDYGHTSLAEHSDCTLAIIAAYFTNGTYPTNDQFCGTEQQLFPSPSITKQTLEQGIVDPALNPEVNVPGHKGSPTFDNADVTTGGGATTTVTTTATVTVSPTTSATAADQDEIDSLKSTKKSLEIALAALGGAFLLALGFVLFTAFRSRQNRSYTPTGIPIVGGGRKGKKSSRGIPVPLDDDDEGEDAFLPPMKEGSRGLSVGGGYANESPRASMETLKGYSDPYDPPSSALGSTSLGRPTGGAPGLTPPSTSDRPGSPNYRYADAGNEYRDHA